MNKSLAIFVACLALVLALLAAPAVAQERGGGTCHESGKTYKCPTYRFWREFGFYEYREYDAGQYSIAAAVIGPHSGRHAFPHRAIGVAFEHLVSYVRGNNSANATVGAEFPLSIEWFTYNHTIDVYIVEIWLQTTTTPPTPNDTRLAILETTAGSTYFTQPFSYGAVPDDMEINRHARAFQFELITQEDVFISNVHTVSFYDYYNASGGWTKEISYYALPIGNTVDLHTRKSFQSRAPMEWIKMAVGKF